MLEIIALAVALTKPPKIDPIVFEPKTTQVEPKKPTLEEKIKTNHYKCDTDTEYIRADTAKCKPKPTPEPQKTVKPAPVQSDGNLYGYLQCTYHAKNMRPDLPNNLGNAISWVQNAQSQGIPTGTEARVGAIGQQGNHVVYIRKVDGDRVYLSERNWNWNGGYRERWASARDFIYIY